MCFQFGITERWEFYLQVGYSQNDGKKQNKTPSAGRDLLEDLFPLQDQSSTDWFEKSKFIQTFIIIYKKWWLCLWYLLNFLASAKVYTQHFLITVIISSKGMTGVFYWEGVILTVLCHLLFPCLCIWIICLRAFSLVCSLCLGGREHSQRQPSSSDLWGLVDKCQAPHPLAC